MANAKTSNESSGNKKAIWKKWWFWVIVVVIFGAVGSSSEDTTQQPETVVENEQESEPTQATEKEEIKPTQTTESEQETTAVETEIKETEQSNQYNGKNIDDINAHFSVSKVRNDVTDNWYISSIAESVNIEEYALSYYKKYFTDDAQVHFIVNFNYNTTTKISNVGGILHVTISEYVEDSEHDAKKLLDGMLLKEYLVYIDTGVIEEVQ